MTTLELPAEWRALVRPRRGRSTASVAPLDPDAASQFAKLVERRRPGLTEHFGLPNHDPELAAAGLAGLGGERTPVSVAALLAGLRSLGEHELSFVADALVSAHGLAFAAIVLLERVRLRPTLRWVDWPAFEKMDWRLRELAAVADDATYAEAVDAVREHRLDPARQLVSAGLLPSETAWVDECCAARLGDAHRVSPLVLASVSTPEQLIAAGFGEQGRHESGFYDPDLGILYTLLDGLGPAAAPFVAQLWDGGSTDAAGGALLELDTDEAFQLMLDRVDVPAMQPFMVRAVGRYPVRALRLLAEAGARDTKVAQLARRLLHQHLLAHPELGQEVELSPRARDVLADVLVSTVRMPAASDDTLPALLVAPPWLDRPKAAKPVVRTDLAAPTEVALAWRPGEQEDWLAPASADPHANEPEVWAHGLRRHHDYENWQHSLDEIAYGPEELVRPLLTQWQGSLSDSDLMARLVVARYGAAALPIALQVAKSSPANRGGVLGPFVAAAVAEMVAGWLGSKQGRNAAYRWLDRHREDAARLLVPAALSKPGPRRTAAEVALRYLAAGTDVAAAAGHYDDAARDAIAAFLAVDPLTVLPAKLPVLPEWVDPDLLPQIRLAGTDTALPAEATRHVCMMFALSKPDAPYPGIEIVRGLAEPASLTAFGWALFERWQLQGSPGSEDWILGALSHVGDDDIVRRLAPLIRVWPGQGGHNRAVLGLDVLAAIGSEAALMRVAGIAQNVKFKGLRTKAEEKIQDIAEHLGLAPEDLADRLVPTLGLDEPAALTFDYGARSFRIGFDEALRPFVTDEHGARRKDLPKPGAKDDPELAPAEFKRFAALKKDLRTVAADQIRRLETAMVDERQWPFAAFRDVFVAHPLLVRLAQRLVWRTETGIAFRVAEDGTFADLDDDELTVPQDARVGIAHPLHLGDTVANWARLFADYEILQPFPQLGRAVHTMTEDELGTGRLTRFEGVTVASAAVHGLRRRGWELGRPQDNGSIWWVSRAVPGHRSVVVGLDPGMTVDRLDFDPEQVLSAVWFNPGPAGSQYPPKTALPFAELAPVLASEIVSNVIEVTS
ncbi:MAG TPA: DUF4132 domain-containing protein [Pseudonocardiaceae bacterium]|jgi:hypothetical protein